MALNKQLRKQIRRSLDLKGVFNPGAIADLVNNLERDFVLIPRADLPEVTRSGSGLWDEVSTGEGGWSFGVNEDDAPSAADPLHLIAIIEWFQANGHPLHGEAEK